jgi:2-polyprenyl-6-methoxyphenol hydroxylase-like FAD-dependent oxidoreductase
MALLRTYQAQRYRDNETVLFGTDLANRLFSTGALPQRGLRRLALLGLDWLPPLRHAFLRYAMGVAPGQSPATALVG